MIWNIQIFFSLNMFKFVHSGTIFSRGPGMSKLDVCPTLGLGSPTLSSKSLYVCPCYILHGSWVHNIFSVYVNTTVSIPSLSYNFKSAMPIGTYEKISLNVNPIPLQWHNVHSPSLVLLLWRIIRGPSRPAATCRGRYLSHVTSLFRSFIYYMNKKTLFEPQCDVLIFTPRE